MDVVFPNMSAGDVAVYTLCLAILEKVMDTDFVCPCQPVFNELKCACYAIVPFFFFLFFTLKFVDFSSKTQNGGMEDKSKRKVSCSTQTSPKMENRRRDDIPESEALSSAVGPIETDDIPRNKVPCSADTSPMLGDKGTKRNSTREKYLFSSFIAITWLFFFFVDGQYVSCACSYWGGKYTETGALKWCKPTGNETEVFQRKQETLRMISISQVSSELHTAKAMFLLYLFHYFSFSLQVLE